MAAKKTRGPSPSSKTSFILAQDPSKSASEIVQIAKAAGHVVNEGYVHSIRSRARVAAKKGRGRGPVTPDRAARALEKLASKGMAASSPAAASSAASSAAAPKRGPGRPRKVQGGESSTGGAALIAEGSLESQFAAIAVELGISRAEAILRRVREVLERLTF